jgi:LCP family protein required for cell wall assembly
MADPPRGDRPQYNVYRAGSDAPPKGPAKPPDSERPQQPAPEGPPAQAPPGGQPGPAPGDGPPPQYNVYKSGVRDRVGGGGGGGGGRKLPSIRGLRRRRGEPGDPTTPRSPGRIAIRVLKWAAALAAVWILLSIVLFFVSAQTQPGVDQKAKDALSPGGTMLTGSTVLVLGSDARPKNSKEPGAGGPSRSDSILLMHVGVGSVRRLSIPRDSVADIPGHGRDKINAAFAYGGPALTIKTVEGFLGNGLKVNHIILVDFQHFPDFIDSLGGVDVTLKKCIKSPPFGGKKLNLKRGTHHLTGRQALAFARVRKNKCAPAEDDRARAARQQQVLSAIKSQALSLRTFFHAPWVAWNAPRAIRSDVHGPGLTALAIDLTTGGSGKTEVLKPETLDPFIVSDSEKRDQVKRLLGK